MKSHNASFCKPDKCLAWLVLVILLAMPLCLAETFGGYPSGNPVKLVFSCQNSTYLNISKIYLYPNSTFMINGETATTRAGSTYNYTLDSGNTTIIGTYVVVYHCDLNGVDTPSNAYYTINSSGFTMSTSQGMMMVLLLVAIAFLAFLFFYFGVKTENITLKIFCLAMSVLFIIFMFGYGYNVANIMLGEYPSITGGMSSIYILMIVLLSAGGAGLMLWLIAYIFTLWSKHRGFRD